MSPSSNTTPQGGFLQGIPQVSETSALPSAASGCCGTTNQVVNTGCCGEPAAQGPAATSVQTTQGCCGEPVTTPTAMASPTQTGCCN